MHDPVTNLFVCSLICIAIAASFIVARREYLKGRRERQFSQLLRRVMLSPEGEAANLRKRVLKWQSCEPTSARFS